jgi:PilZ domain-containing protein
MLDRRQSGRDKVIYEAGAEIGKAGPTRDCVVRDLSDRGASIQVNSDINLPKEQMSLRIARKGRSFLAKVIWWRDNFVGVVFSSERPYELPVSDLEERLRKSQKKKRQLQRRIDKLLGEG